MGFLALDIGNTKGKYGYFSAKNTIDTLVETGGVYDLSKENIEGLLSGFNYPKAIISSVRPLSDEMTAYFRKKSVLILSPELKMPFTNTYYTKETLGSDRLAAVAGAIHIFPDRPVLVIDAGTCITYEWVSESGTYLGGAISPGLNMRYRAMHTMTGKLPLLSPPETWSAYFGKDTESCMHSGVIKGLMEEVDVFVDQFFREYGGGEVLICGGDAGFIEKNSRHKLRIEQHLVLLGLLKILQLNA